MTTKTFTASNGVEIETTVDGCLCTVGSIGYVWAGIEGVEALREYFQHERDRELGRWRDPDNPDFVVYRRPKRDDELGRAVWVLDETTATGYTYWEKSTPAWPGKYAQMWKAAERYYEAHPEPRPWDEAETGEIWELTDPDGHKQLWVKWVKTERGLWRSIHSSKPTYYDAKNATAGRRIWPEEGIA